MFSLSLYTYNEIRRIKNEAFERGEKHGKEIAINDLINIQKHNCTNLTEEEKNKVIKYLIDNNLEFGYNEYLGGFYIMKKNKTFKNTN